MFQYKKGENIWAWSEVKTRRLRLDCRLRRPPPRCRSSCWRSPSPRPSPRPPPDMNNNSTKPIKEIIRHVTTTDKDRQAKYRNAIQFIIIITPYYLQI